MKKKTIRRKLKWTKNRTKIGRAIYIKRWNKNKIRIRWEKRKQWVKDRLRGNIKIGNNELKWPEYKKNKVKIETKELRFE